ncbi:hypothetical protein [Stenoxybacter acetivorans]|uniref:hypothetical protein n=1 Tax=Stenoxybacter acetivorans TaxID=422441 RepID=UPI0006925EB4|nr:hypothetical protein [Stenoxybacter acetivorans]
MIQKRACAFPVLQRLIASADPLYQVFEETRLRLPLAFILEIADTLAIEPLEIIAGLELGRKSCRHTERVKSLYFEKLILTIGRRMSLDCGARFYFRHW